jgi:hypothetical protein
MVGGGRHVHDVQDRTEGSPERRSELSASVAGNRRGHAETLDPALKKGACAVGGGDVLQRDSFRPSRGAIYDSKKVVKT